MLRSRKKTRIFMDGLNKKSLEKKKKKLKRMCLNVDVFIMTNADKDDNMHKTQGAILSSFIR